MAGENDPNPLELLFRANQLQDLSLLLKQHYHLSESPPEAPWRTDFDDAYTVASHGAWEMALKRFEALAEHTAGRPPILRNIAILHTFLGGAQTAATAWR